MDCSRIISPLNEDTLSINGTVAFNKSVTANTIGLIRLVYIVIVIRVQ